MIAKSGLLLCALFGSMALVQDAEAALIVEYNFNDLNGVADVVHPLVTATDFTAGGGLTNQTFGGANAAARNFGEASAAAAVTAADYWEFTVTADAGYVLNLTNLTFDDFRGTAGPTDLQLRVNDVVFANFTTATTTSNRNIDLSSLTGLTSATFRIIGFNDANSGTNSNLFIDNVQLNGTAAPEPSALLLCGVLVPGALAYRRRRQSKTNVQTPAA